ncbi:MAG: DUF2171 domain-containing protein [Actinomycetota bacterium]
MNDDERPLAWTALEQGTPVVASGGREIGRITDVVGDLQKDIFSGVTFRHGLLDSHHFVPADAIASITAQSVVLKIDEAQAEALEPR